MPGKFVIKRAKDKEFFFNLLAPNGEVILTSETYSSKTGAMKGIAAVQTNAAEPDRYDGTLIGRIPCDVNLRKLR